MEILIVMSKHQTAEKIRHHINQCGHHVVLAETMEAATAILSHRQFDLSFVDFSLPDGDGLELIKLIKTFYPKTRIVAMTDSHSRFMEISVRKLGIIYYMQEPFEALEAGYIADHLSKKVSNF